MVSPINNGDNLKYLAILTLEFTSLSAENHSKNNQTINKIIARTISKITYVKHIFLRLLFCYLKAMEN